MPLGSGVRYRFKGKTRLAFKDGKVIEVQKFKGKKGHMKKAGSAKHLRPMTPS